MVPWPDHGVVKVTDAHCSGSVSNGCERSEALIASRDVNGILN